MNSANKIKTGGSFLHRAPWLVRGVAGSPQDLSGDLIADGGVLVANGRIAAAGPFAELRKGHDGPVIDHEGAILAPALLNCHAHLELSHLADLCATAGIGPEEDFTDWARTLVSERRQRARSGMTEVLARGRQALADLRAGGVILTVDIGNLAESRMISQGQAGRVIFLQELIGLAGKSEIRALNLLPSGKSARRQSGAEAVNYTAHAPYSCGPELIRRLKDLARIGNRLFSIHVAETLAELEFLQSGTGSLRKFMAEMGEWQESFIVPGMRPVGYLDSLGVLDEKTLCVHAVHVTDPEIACLAERRAKVCLCPASNRRLKAGKSPAVSYLAHGILPGLGTDSLASNDRLNLWQEMMLLREDHPALTPESVFAMATRGGAEALGLDREMGRISPGAAASFLAVRAAEVKTADQVFEYLTSSGTAIELTWVE